MNVSQNFNLTKVMSDIDFLICCIIVENLSPISVREHHFISRLCSNVFSAGLLSQTAHVDLRITPPSRAVGMSAASAAAGGHPGSAVGVSQGSVTGPPQKQRGGRAHRHRRQRSESTPVDLRSAASRERALHRL